MSAVMAMGGVAEAVDAYRQEPLGNGRIRFLVTPAAVSRSPAGVRLLGAVVAAAAFGIALGRLGLWRSAAVAGAVFATCWWLGRWGLRLLGQRLDRRRSPGGSFIASPAGIELPGGGTILQEQLRGLVLRNALEPRAVPSDAGRSSMARVSYMLCAEQEGRSVTLAGGMSRATADELLQETRYVLRLSTARLLSS